MIIIYSKSPLDVNRVNDDGAKRLAACGQAKSSDNGWKINRAVGTKGGLCCTNTHVRLPPLTSTKCRKNVSLLRLHS